MEISLIGQVQLVFISMIFGVILGVIYDIFRIIRIIMQTDNNQLFFLDILYFILCGFLTFIFAMAYNFGEVRFYIIGGEIIGALLYYFTVGEFVIKGFYIVFMFIKRLCNFIKIKTINPIYNFIKCMILKLLICIKSIKNRKNKMKYKIHLKDNV